LNEAWSQIQIAEEMSVPMQPLSRGQEYTPRQCGYPEGAGQDRTRGRRSDTVPKVFEDLEHSMISVVSQRNKDS